MKKIALLLFACSVAFAQVEDNGYEEVGNEEVAAGADSSVQAPAPQEVPLATPLPQESAPPAPEPPARVEPIAYDDTKAVQPAAPKEETWEDAWQKRRHNVSAFF